MAELDKTISVIESWLKQPVLTPPPINELYDALELLKEQEDIGTELTNAVELIHKKNERIEKLLKEQDYRGWLMDMFHKYGRDDLIALLVLPEEENLLADVLKGQETQKFFVDESGNITPLPAVVRCKDCINCVKEPNGELYCDILAVGYEPLGSKKVTDDWFCADGERAENAR